MKTNLFIWLGDKLSKIFKKSRPFAEAAVKAVNILKDAVESPILKTLTDLTATTADDKVLACLRVWIPKIALQLGLVSDSIYSPDAIIKNLIKHLQIKSKDQRVIDWTNISALVYAAMLDGDIDLQEAIKITQAIYKEIG